MTYTVFVPRYPTQLALMSGPLAGIARGSAIVGVDRLDSDVIQIDFEGNVYGSQNLLTFGERVTSAISRAETRYPTTARRTVGRDLLVPVGQVHDRRLFLNASAGQLVVWLGVLLLDPRELALG